MFEKVNFFSPDRGFDLSHGDLLFVSSRRFLRLFVPVMAIGDLN